MDLQYTNDTGIMSQIKKNQPSLQDAEYVCVGWKDNNKDGKLDNGEWVEIDWQHPNAVLYLPIPGYIYCSGTSQALIYPGSEGLYWTASAINTVITGENITPNNSPRTGGVARIKFSGDHGHRNVFVRVNDHRYYGCSVRCIRDTKATH